MRIYMFCNKLLGILFASFCLFHGILKKILLHHTSSQYKISPKHLLDYDIFSLYFGTEWESLVGTAVSRYALLNGNKFFLVILTYCCSLLINWEDTFHLSWGLFYLHCTLPSINQVLYAKQVPRLLPLYFTKSCKNMILRNKNFILILELLSLYLAKTFTKCGSNVYRLKSLNINFLLHAIDIDKDSEAGKSSRYHKVFSSLFLL